MPRGRPKRAEEQSVSNPIDPGSVPGIDPIIVGLLERLPPVGQEWSTPDRKLWLELLEKSFLLVYREPKEQPAQ